MMKEPAKGRHSREESGSDSSPGKWTVFGLVAVGIFMSTLDGSIVNIALPAIMEDFETPLAVVEWVMMIYLLTVSALLLSFGRLSDIRGRRWVYSRGLLAFCAASFLCGWAPSVKWLIFARCLQGLGAAMIMSCTQALIIDAFPASERGKALGTMGTVVASGLTIGPALGGMILQVVSWRFIFYINVPVGIVTAILVSRLLKNSPADISRPESFDVTGAFLLALGTGAFLFALTHGYEYGYAALPISLAMGIFFISISMLFLVETRIRHPIFEPSLLRIRLFTLPLLSALILFMSLFTMIFLMPFFLLHPCGFAMKHAGQIMITPFVFLFLITPFSGALSDRIGSRLLCTIGMAILALALYSLSGLSPVSSPIPVIWRMSLAGIGTALFIAPNSSTTMSAVPKERMGVASGMVATSRNLGMVMGFALAGAIFNSVFHAESGGINFKVYRPDLAPFFMSAFQKAMMAGALVAGIGIPIACLRGSERKP